MGMGFKLEPGTTWELHLCAQDKALIWLHGFHSPEIDGISDAHFLRISPPAAE